ncbi:carbohydrate esterase family 5 protein [Xylaria nigripes]|nr:carbohydrate esterase family 5 protein [Xylaria nigripes]
MKPSLLVSIALLSVASARTMTYDLSDEMLTGFSADEDAEIFGGPKPNKTANDFNEHGCSPVIFLYARGTLQQGNLGSSPGPQVIEQLRATLSNTTVSAQGFNYHADLWANFSPEGCHRKDAGRFGELLTLAATQCSESKIVISGYSQGAAIVHAAAKRVTPAVADRVVAVVTFGDTRKAQDKGYIPGIEQSRVLILCHRKDKVCHGTLLISDAHYHYHDLAPQAVEFIVSKL